MKFHDKLPRGMMRKRVRDLEAGESGYVLEDNLFVDFDGCVWIGADCRVYNEFKDVYPAMTAVIAVNDDETRSIGLRKSAALPINSPHVTDRDFATIRIEE
ncbi:hypothetical protein [Nocardia jiangxiensis]|uniref:hypothetical protein n=1 Tax=Nocardia jiangxiensis TaxID=282685 RepID=UPI00030FFB5C|nr:hypothetical protein [Nocardia jiangxiensis]